MQCPMCRAYFEPRRSDQGYCSAACNKKGSNLALKRALRIYNALYHWRLEHKTFGANMRFVCREVASWIREDRDMQRLPPPPHNHDSNRGHERAPRKVVL